MYNVYLIQPQMKWKSIWLPYTIASLWTYLEQFQFVQKNFTVKDLIYTRDDIQNQLENIIDPDICLFSCYVWNWEYNNLLAQKIKQKYPNCIIVFGGPQIPEDQTVAVFLIWMAFYSTVSLILSSIINYYNRKMKMVER